MGYKSPASASQKTKRTSKSEDDPVDKDKKETDEKDDTSQKNEVTAIEKDIVEESNPENSEPKEEEEMIKLQPKEIADTKVNFSDENEDVKEEAENAKIIEPDEVDREEEKIESDSEEEL